MGIGGRDRIEDMGFHRDGYHGEYLGELSVEALIAVIEESIPIARIDGLAVDSKVVQANRNHGRFGAGGGAKEGALEGENLAAIAARPFGKENDSLAGSELGFQFADFLLEPIPFAPFDEYTASKAGQPSEQGCVTHFHGGDIKKIPLTGKN